MNTQVHLATLHRALNAYLRLLREKRKLTDQVKQREQWFLVEGEYKDALAAKRWLLKRHSCPYCSGTLELKEVSKEQP